ncbi:MAG: hypothetical protein WCH46_08730 [bacterium]
MKTLIKILAINLTLLAAIPAMAQVRVGFDIRFGPPPPPPCEVYGLPPCEGAYWVPGYYNHGAYRYFWVPGRWERPRPRYEGWWREGWRHERFERHERRDFYHERERDHRDEGRGEHRGGGRTR